MKTCGVHQHARRAVGTVVTSVTLACLMSNPGWAQRAPAAAAGECPLTAARVGVSARGAVAVNGVITQVERLATALQALNPRPTEVCYFREKPAGEPPPTVRAIVDAIASLKVPISFYSDAAFTQRVGMPQ